MTKKLSPILTDAVIVIGAHNEQYWELLCNSYQIAIPATILEDELFYFGSKNNTHAIMPSKWVEEGKVQRLEAELLDFQVLQRQLSENFMNSLDPGELEALALLGSKKYKNYLFTTADRAAIKTLGVLGWSSQGISVEALLKRVGAPKKTLNSLPKHFTKKWFDACLQEGFMEKDLWTKNMF